MKFTHLKYSFAALVLGVTYFNLNLIFQWNILDHLEHIIQRQQHFELLIPLFILINGILADLGSNYIHFSRAKKLEQERLHTLKATMNKVNDLVNNFLNNLQYYQLRLESNGTLTPEEHNQVRNLIWKTSHKLRQLEKVDRVIINDESFRQIELSFPIQEKENSL